MQTKCGKTSPSNPFLLLLLALALILAGLTFDGCTIAPRQAQKAAPSFDGFYQDSGFAGFREDGSGLITDAGRARYNALAVLYGQRFLVPVRPDDGITEGPTVDRGRLWRIDPEHLVKFERMARWHRQAAAH